MKPPADGKTEFWRDPSLPWLERLSGGVLVLLAPGVLVSVAANGAY